MKLKLLLLLFILQYNPLFLKEYLWLDYWRGSSFRLFGSFIFIVIAIIFDITKRKKSPPKGSLQFILGALFVWFYGTLTGLITNSPIKYIIADGVFYIELAAYLWLFGRWDYSELKAFLKLVVKYSVYIIPFTILLFILSIPEIAVGAVVNGERIVRLTDLFIPLILIIIISENSMFSNNRKLTFLLLSIYIIIGFYRSEWIAIILVLILYFRNKMLNITRSLIVLILLVLSLFLFEFLYEIILGVPQVITGRIIAGVGSADSVGRLEVSFTVLKQYFNSGISIVFGNGFGSMVWFVNDFGDGPILAYQPVGSISNYWIAIIFQFGIISIFLIAIILYFSITKMLIHGEKTEIFTLVLSYLFFQFLTFPSTIHFPIAMIIALVYNYQISKRNQFQK